MITKRVPGVCSPQELNNKKLKTSYLKKNLFDNIFLPGMMFDSTVSIYSHKADDLTLLLATLVKTKNVLMK